MRSHAATCIQDPCARLGLRCELVLTRSVPRDGEAYERSGNVALDLLYGARVHLCDDEEATEATYRRLIAEAVTDGRAVATFPVGGSSEVGVLGYVNAAAELHAQLGDTPVDRIVCAVGSAGTAFSSIRTSSNRIPPGERRKATSRVPNPALTRVTGAISLAPAARAASRAAVRSSTSNTT